MAAVHRRADGACGTRIMRRAHVRATLRFSIGWVCASSASGTLRRSAAIRTNIVRLEAAVGWPPPLPTAGRNRSMASTFRRSNARYGDQREQTRRRRTSLQPPERCDDTTNRRVHRFDRQSSPAPEGLAPRMGKSRKACRRQSASGGRPPRKCSRKKRAHLRKAANL